MAKSTPKRVAGPISKRAKALSQYMISIGDKTADVARRSGVKYTTIHSFLSGHTSEMTRSIEDKIAEAYSLSADELFGGKLPEPAPQAREAADAVRIGKDNFWPVPVYDVRAAAGAGAFVEDGDPTTYQMFRDQFLQRVSRAPLSALSVIYVSGDSMWDTLHEGDTILVDRSERRVVKDGIYVLRLDDGLLVKRCSRKLPGVGVIVSSDNPKYPQQMVDNHGDLDVIGRVIWIGRALG